MADPAKSFQVLILAPTAADAEGILAVLKRAQLPVRGAFSQNPKSLTRISHCDLILACVNEVVSARKTAAAYAETDQHIPLIVVAPPGADDEDVLHLLRCGARGLLSPDDEIALVKAVRREWKIWNLVRQAEALQVRLKRSEKHLQALLRAGADGRGGAAPSDRQNTDNESIVRALIGTAETQGAGHESLVDLLSPDYREALEPLLGKQPPAASPTVDGPEENPAATDSRTAEADAPLEVHPPSTPVDTGQQAGAELPPLTLAVSEEPLPDLSDKPQTLSAREVSDDELIDQIERALENDGFKLAYQPIVSLRGDSQEKYGVLLRLLDDNRAFRAADDLLEPAARSGRLPEVDRWVIQHALADLSHRRQAGHRVHFFLSLSSAVLQDPELLIWICDQLRLQSIRGNWVSFQIRESDARDLTEAAVNLGTGLRQIRSGLAISDFGLNTDSELLFSDFPLDYVKLAPSLTQGLQEDPLKQGRVKHLLATARKQNVRSIVGRIQDEYSLAEVWRIGADYVQGKLIGRPSSVFDLDQ